MSRCFPYQPKCCVEAIKIQKEKEKKSLSVNHKAKRDSKERKKHKHRKENNGGTCYDGRKFHREGGSFFQKDTVEEAEKSGLTEEHNQPVSIQSARCLSDDGIQSSKRKLDDSASNDDKPRNIICIRLPLRRHKEPDKSPNRQGLCSTSGRVGSIPVQDEIVHVSNRERSCPANEKACKVGEPSCPANEKACKVGDIASPPGKNSCTSASERKLGSAHLEAETSSPFRLYVGEKLKQESPYKRLIEDWVPPPLKFEVNCLDDWIFESSKHEGIHGNKRLKASHDVSCLGSSILWPRARYLPDADVHALPYTIPF